MKTKQFLSICLLTALYTVSSFASDDADNKKQHPCASKFTETMTRSKRKATSTLLKDNAPDAYQFKCEMCQRGYYHETEFLKHKKSSRCRILASQHGTSDTEKEQKNSVGQQNIEHHLESLFGKAFVEELVNPNKMAKKEDLTLTEKELFVDFFPEDIALDTALSQQDALLADRGLLFDQEPVFERELTDALSAFISEDFPVDSI